MDDYVFQNTLSKCQYVYEKTTYLEIFTYTV